MEKAPSGTGVPIRAQTAAAAGQSKKMCRPVSTTPQATQRSDGAQFLKKRLARELRRSMSVR
jgi:hypothetical protein